MGSTRRPTVSFHLAGQRADGCPTHGDVEAVLEYCLSNNRVTSNPARAVKNPRGREVKAEEQKLPFTDAELKRMYQACENYGTDRHTWKGEEVADFISLSIYTGLRISDVAQFHIRRMNESGEITLRTTKAGIVMCTWVPEWPQERIKARAEVRSAHLWDP